MYEFLLSFFSLSVGLLVRSALFAGLQQSGMTSLLAALRGTAKEVLLALSFGALTYAFVQEGVSSVLHGLAGMRLELWTIALVFVTILWLMASGADVLVMRWRNRHGRVSS